MLDAGGEYGRHHADGPQIAQICADGEGGGGPSGEGPCDDTAVTVERVGANHHSPSSRTGERGRGGRGMR